MPEHPYTIDGHAERRTDIAGWVCAKCKRFYGDEGGAEQAAAYCCSKHRACEDCGQPAEKHWLRCRDCRTKREIQKHALRERAPWDGVCMIYSDAADRWFSTAEDAMDWLEEDDFDSARFLLSTPDNGREFCMAEFLDDSLPTEDGELHADAREIEKAVNDWIAANAPYSWHPSKIAWDGEVPHD